MSLLTNDFAMVALAFVAVFVYVMFMTQSIFYATMIMGQIFLCFTLAFTVYRAVYGAFFGTFHI